MRSYETTFILTPVLSDEQTQEGINQYKLLLKEQGAEIVHEESIGLKNLAYPIQGKNLGFYYCIEFRSEAPLLETLNTTYKRDERVIRYLTIRLDKHAQAYNESRRKKLEAQASTQEK